MTLQELLTDLDWRAPAWLLLSLQPFVVLGLRRWHGVRAARRYAAPALLPWVRLPSSGRYGTLRTIAHVLAWALAAMAAAGPRLPQLEPGQSQRAGVDWMIAVDLSRSMDATDIQPSRLKRARIELLRLLPQLRGDRVGLMVFAGHAHVIAPPTHDTDALARYLDLLQTDLIPTLGSRPDRAIDLAEAALAAHGEHARALLLITDNAGDAAVTAAAAERSRRAGVPVYVLGMGSAGGSIDWTDARRGQTRAVAVPLDQQSLAAIAERGGGRYAGVADDDSDLQRLYQRGIATLAQPRPEFADTDVQWRELYPWLLFPALLLFAATLLVHSPPRAARSSSALAMALLAVVHIPSGRAAEALSGQAYEAYREAQYQTARDLYARMAGYEARLGEGASAYRLNDFPRALREFTRAVLEAPDDRRRAAALLNLGNAYFQVGDYRNAVTAFEDALRYQPDFSAADHNLTLARLVADAVQRRIPGNRPGPGQRTADANQADGPGPLTLAEQALSPPPGAPDALPKLSQDAWASLIARGLRHARLAGPAGDANRVETAAAIDIDPSPAALAHMGQLQQDPSQLWRRLLEREQGFLAPLPQPSTLPGESPW